MKINNFNRVNLNPYIKQAEKLEKAEKAGRKDKVEISPEAKELQQVSQIELERQEKVKKISEQIKAGEYEIKPEEIARKLYDFWNNSL
ncbi:flagellar biosynthesis anti-sigma factor FlgM [Bacillus sp. M6-12]|uniref:flagellar biosynthesis anti-sigma factor FlgM n=1 Tax=Bacillus sp. M6-12 TaxID=2054166 RepID=UPI000C788306|nr:flagellar biosynthesis anti-sigma factor FlgM [Bacillus sp. M6-12]PLS17867.1 flagellar biosynthesis anti-sigma factor FlgM [Bacillus sp. M6-12]